MSQDLEITVNRRRFDASDGVRARMSAAEIAALVGVPARNAVVERETARERYTSVPCSGEIEVQAGMHFLVTREFVMGG